ncbi:MAG: O-acetyl-ADP-ribose deacetylase [Verrucomicrobiota bacterium]
MNTLFGDITTLNCDAIVNAANTSLLGGGGVDGAIHRAAGPELVHECRILGGCKPGMAKITKGYQLKARHIIHTVGPVWIDGSHGEKETLVSCYVNSLELCRQYDIQSLAFPCISTGIYAFPKDLAAKIAVTTCHEFIASHPINITFCCFGKEDFELYQNLLSPNNNTQNDNNAQA